MLNKIREQLLTKPFEETINRKPLRPDPRYPDANYWEVRFGEARAYYRLKFNQPHALRVVAVGSKEGNLVRIASELVKSEDLIEWLVNEDEGD